MNIHSEFGTPRDETAAASIVEITEMPGIVQLDESFHVAVFPLMKLIPAHYILAHAQASGQLGPDTVIVESSSGTFGLALAMLSALMQRRLVLISDPAIDRRFRRRLEDLGAQVDIVARAAETGGYQQARLDRLQHYRDSIPDHFWPCQYHNPNNPRAYAPIVELLTSTIGRIDCLVGTVGSGGSMCGIGRLLRGLFPKLTVIGIDTHGSVLFGLQDRPRTLRGLGNSINPANLDHTLFDEIHWVSGAEAFYMTRELHRRHAIFQGGTSGAAYMVGRWWASRHPGQNVVALLPDSGDRYLDTIYDDEWLEREGLLRTSVPNEPRVVDGLADIELESCWTSMAWHRSTFEARVGRPYPTSAWREPTSSPSGVP